MLVLVMSACAFCEECLSIVLKKCRTRGGHVDEMARGRDRTLEARKDVDKEEV